jgi:hypothetical protein
MGIEEWYEQKAEKEDKKAFFELLINNDDLEGTALGITKQVVGKGEDSLTPNQKPIFKRYVLDVFAKPCKNGCDIPWDDKYEAYHDWGGYCFDCHDGMTKYRDE